jgi:hypothetical protein
VFILIPKHQVFFSTYRSLCLRNELSQSMKLSFQISILLFLSEGLLGVVISFSLKSFYLVNHIVEGSCIGTRSRLRMSVVLRSWAFSQRGSASLSRAFILRFVGLSEIKPSLIDGSLRSACLDSIISGRRGVASERRSSLTVVPGIVTHRLGLVQSEHGGVHFSSQIFIFTLISRHF